MGHYAAEMMCDGCGKTRCECPLEEVERNYWLVDDDFCVVTATEFLFKHRDEHSKFAALMFKKHYKTRLTAERAALKECEEAVEAARRRLLHLKKVCKVLRPWEKK